MLNKPSVWKELERAWKIKQTQRIDQLFSGNSDRFNHYSISAEGIVFDYSKTSIDWIEKQLLIHLASLFNVGNYRDSMFAGNSINFTENRPVLHIAERQSGNFLNKERKQSVRITVKEQHQRCYDFAKKIRNSTIKPQNASRFTDVINLGVGGSDLGPRMVARALSPFSDGPKIHFVSNIDSADFSDTISKLNPETTLIVVVSKTFTTLETVTNAIAAKKWITQSLQEEAVQHHFVAVSAAYKKCEEFGINPDRIFPFEEWVGGRYSIWSAVGLSAMIALGSEQFKEFLSGGQSIDNHFVSQPLRNNIPVMLALVGLWHQQVCKFPTRAVIPYEQRLEYFPSYLQQLEMESNGKSTKTNGDFIERQSGPIVWGGTGTNSQHAFFQHIHQGKQITPCEFLIGIEGHEHDLKHHHDYLVANCLAQAEALMRGGDKPERNPNDGSIKSYQFFEGNRPSTTLVYKKLTPFTLGQLIAIYEHRVFVEGIILEINSFDQWGVELGKTMANQLYPLVSNPIEHIEKISPSLLGILGIIHKK